MSVKTVLSACFDGMTLHSIEWRSPFKEAKP
jgi:hypothetical protein